MKLSLYYPIIAAWHVVAAPLEGRQAGPVVTIGGGTVIGSTALTVDSFKGIPFAQPPVGSLRLKPPRPLTSSFGTLVATGVPRACPQFNSQVNTTSLPSAEIAALSNSPLGQAITDSGEDCLTLNVQRPSGTTSNSSLPVVAWIFGGGFEFGSTQTYDATSLITQSILLGTPVIYVAMNYRVGGFGFLGGKELAADGSTNLGLRDQRLALQWIQDNIKAFGGDPTKVTIWGESAGAISVFDHTIMNGGDNTYKGKPLFRAAIMDSGSVVPADTVTGPSAQNIYNTVVNAAGCASSSNTLSCLRLKDYNTFANAVNSVPGIFSYRSLDLSYLPRPDPANSFFPISPESAVASGKFAKVPIIIGDQEDEGTLFALSLANITTTDQVIDYIATYFPTNPNARADVAGLVANYPDTASAGSPFNTGGLNNVSPQFKRLAAILGDVTFTLTRRTYLASVAAQLPATYSYLASYLYGTPVLGTFHASDIPFAYGYGGVNVPTTTIQTYYIAFVNALDPNALGTTAPLIPWPKWSVAAPNLVNFQALANVVLPDTFRQAAGAYLASKPSAFRV